MNRQKWFAYGLWAAAGVAAYFWLARHPQWTLLPYARALSVLLGLHFYETPQGYEAAGLGFAITASCSGVNLFASLYAVLLYVVPGRCPAGFRRGMAAAACLAGALLIGFLVTLARILLSLPFCGSPRFKLIHTVLSLCVYFGAVLCVHSLSQKVIGRLRRETEPING